MAWDWRFDASQADASPSSPPPANLVHEGGQPNWLELPAFPTSGEITTPYFPPAPINQPRKVFRSKEEYLETYYRLCRCEATDPLRLAVLKFRQNPSKDEEGDIHIYTQVSIDGYAFSNQDGSARVSFSTERCSGINWRQPKLRRLIPGSLVALSPDDNNFSTQCFLATVTRRRIVGGLLPGPEEDPNTPPRIDIRWTEEKNATIDPMVSYVMVEARAGFFESLSHTLEGLQQAAHEHSILDKYIVGGQTDIQSSQGYEEQQTPPEPESSRALDSSQHAAFSAMTAQELSIIQGPPGTGKTFTTWAAIEKFVAMRRLGAGGELPPLVLTAQTNHAVDQLLKRCMADDKISIVRLGGQSRDSEIQELSIHALRRESKIKRHGGEARARRRQCFNNITNLLKACFPETLVRAETFHSHELLSDEQLLSLRKGEWEAAPGQAVQDSDDPNPIAIWLDQFWEPGQRFTTTARRHHGRHATPEVADEEIQDIFGEPEIDDGDKFKEPDFIALPLNNTGRIPNGKKSTWEREAKKLLMMNPDLFCIKPGHRGIVYRYLLQKLVQETTAKFRRLLLEYAEICKELKTAQTKNDTAIIGKEDIDIIGCTTTGLAKYRELFLSIGPKVLVVEEAAQILEAGLTSCLFPSLQHLALVGDHQQLRPSVVVQELMSRHHNLDVSLFERLVNMGSPYYTLTTQRRMAPAIRRVMQLFYRCDITDHPEVQDEIKLPLIPGMGSNRLLWFHHSWPENSTGSSFSNREEAKMIMGLIEYLILRGTHAKKITILSFYKGQVDLIENLRRALPFQIAHYIAVRTIDSFQGEENDVVILSLVRSPMSGPARVGFLRDIHRAVVSISRAKRGFYILGNADNLADASKDTWGQIIDLFRQDGTLRPCFPVSCPGHDKLNEMSDPTDWQRLLRSGCCPAQFPESLNKAWARNKPALASRPVTDLQARLRPQHDQQRARYRSSDDFLEAFTQSDTSNLTALPEAAKISPTSMTGDTDSGPDADDAAPQVRYHETWQQTGIGKNGNRIEIETSELLIDLDLD